MDDAAGRIAKQRLFLGIMNVGFWVVVSVAGLWMFTRATAPSIGLTELCFAMVSLLGVQSLFDWAGGTLLMPASALGSSGFLSRWGRAVAVHTGLLVAVGMLLYWSHRWFGSFCPGVILGSFGLMWARLSVLQLLAGVRVRPSSTGDSFCLSADAIDPAFTGGISGMGRSAVILWPAAWEKAFAGTRLEVVRRKRLWEIRSGLPARAFLAATAWNIAGCWTGAWLLELPARVAEHALLLHGFWMTVWGFVGLLLLPSASRSSVYASDHAVAAEGLDVAGWIQTYPGITGEDGSPKLLVQRVFYPIPSAGERLRWFKTFPVLPVLGNVARTNLYLSLATLTLLGRCVHCNVGRPELWVFAPTD